MPSVALVLDRFDPLGAVSKDGAHQLGRYLIQAGYEVHVVTLTFANRSIPTWSFTVCRNPPADWRAQKWLKDFSNS